MDSERTGPKRRPASPWAAVAVVAVLAAGGGGAYWASGHPGGTGHGSAGPGGGSSAGATGAAGAHAMKIESYTASGSALTVRFWGGVCTGYTATAEESSDEVTVRVDAVPGRLGRMCSMIARLFTRTVELDRPLGARKVTDAWDGAALPALPTPPTPPTPPTQPTVPTPPARSAGSRPGTG